MRCNLGFDNLTEGFAGNSLHVTSLHMFLDVSGSKIELCYSHMFPTHDAVMVEKLDNAADRTATQTLLRNKFP